MASELHNADTLCIGCFTAQRSIPSGAACSACGFEDIDVPALSFALPARTILKEQYYIGRVLGHGGFGITYLAWDLNLNLRLAIKEYFPTQWVSRGPDSSSVSVHSQQAREHFSSGLSKFLEEGRTLARFQNHPGIVSVVNYFSAHGTGYLVMSYVEGITFKDYLEQQGGSIPFHVASRVLMPVMDALVQVHGAGVLHRDISPDNIYITGEGHVKLLDFGAARAAPTQTAQSLSVVYKPGFAPPEQYMSQGRQGPWTDVYAIAATLYRAITGRVPTPSVERFYQDDLPPPSAIGVEIPRNAEAALMQALDVDYTRRFQSMRDLQSALIDESFTVTIPRTTRRAEVREPRPTEPPSPPSRVEKVIDSLRSRKREAFAAAGALASLLLALALWPAPAMPTFAPGLSGRWEVDSTQYPELLHSIWNISPQGAYQSVIVRELRGRISVNGQTFIIAWDGGTDARGSFSFEEDGSLRLDDLLGAQSTVTFKRDTSRPVSPLQKTFVGSWSAAFEGFGLAGSRTFVVDPAGNVRLSTSAKGDGRFQAIDGLWKVRSDDGFEDHGNYVAEPAGDRPNRVTLTGRGIGTIAFARTLE